MDVQQAVPQQEKIRLLQRLAEIEVEQQRQQGTFDSAPHYSVLEQVAHGLGQELSCLTQPRAAVERRQDFRQVTWREGSKGKLAGRFAAWRVRPAHRLSAGKEPQESCWLLVEWPPESAQPTRFFFSNLPANASRNRLAAAKSRWWIEHSYRERKDELGLDHVEGRSWRGWRNHIVLVLVAYAFLQWLRQGRKKGALTA